MKGVTTWYDVYRGYDDAALAVLANAGILRRAAKDLESGLVERIQEGEEGGRFLVDGQHVHLVEKGVQHAHCDCPAPGICRHILAAILWVRRDGVPVAEVHHSCAPSELQPVSGGKDALADILSLDPASIYKQAGKAALRQAVLWMREHQNAEVTEQGATLVISFPESALTCRYVAGTGLDGMVSELPKYRRAVVHLAAILMVWRLHGKTFELPGESAAEPPAPSNILTASDCEFLQQVRAVVSELLSNGLSHVSEVTASHLQALNMSARGEGLPRLAAMLRNLEGTIELLAQRDFRADEHEALDQLAKIHALCAAMEMTDADLAPLRGRQRGDHTVQEEMELLSLGGCWWKNRSGARGLTLLFWDPLHRRVLGATQARADDSDPTFTREAVWSLRPLWGSGSPEQISRGSLRLIDGRMNGDSQISTGGTTRALPGAPWRVTDKRLNELGEDDWSALNDKLRGALGLTGYGAEYLVLRPTKVARPILNEVKQHLEWPVFDRKGQGLLLQVECSNGNEKRIANMEALVTRGAEIHLVVVKIEGSQRGIILRPLSVLIAEAGAISPVSLDFANEVPTRTSVLVARIKRMLVGDSAPPVTEGSLSARALAPVLSVVEMLADTGRQELTEIQRETLLRQESFAKAIGLELPAILIRDLLAPAPISPARLLRLYYVGRRCLGLDGLPVFAKEKGQGAG